MDDISQESLATLLALVPSLLLLASPFVLWVLIARRLRRRLSVVVSAVLLLTLAAAGYWDILGECNDAQCGLGLIFLLPLLSAAAVSGLALDWLLSNRREPATAAKHEQLSDNSPTNRWAILSAVLAVLQMPLFVIGPIAAIAFGHIARRELRASQGQGGNALAIFGLVLGYAGLASTILLAIPLWMGPPETSIDAEVARAAEACVEFNSEQNLRQWDDASQSLEREIAHVLHQECLVRQRADELDGSARPDIYLTCSQTDGPSPSCTTSMSAREVGAVVREEVMQGVSERARPEGPVTVGDRKADCRVVNPSTLRASLRREIVRVDHEIDHLRLSDQDLLAAACSDGEYAVATWSSNRHTVVGSYHRPANSVRWSETVTDGPACNFPQEVIELWRIEPITQRCVRG